MLRLTTCLIAVALLLSPAAFADNHAGDSNFAQYGVSVGFSPFGGSLNVAYNSSAKTTWQFSVGGLPGGLLEMDLEIDKTDYNTKMSGSWVGVFLGHRIFNGVDWFRLVAGLGIGRLENELEDKDGNEYTVEYRDNPVGYVGMSFCSPAEKGFYWNVDLGMLQTAGPQIQKVAGSGDDASEEIGDYFMFGDIMPNFQVTLGYQW